MRMIYDTWRLMRVRGKVEKEVRPRYFKQKVFQGLRILVNIGQEYQRYRDEQVKKKVLNVLKRMVQFKRQKRGELKDFVRSRKVRILTNSFYAFREITHKLKQTKGDPFLMRSIIGRDDKDSFYRNDCDLDSEDETEFFEVVIHSKDSIIKSHGLSKPVSVGPSSRLLSPKDSEKNRHYLNEADVSRFIEVLGVDKRQSINLKVQ
ncbi:hypothetical protein FGO68_gene17691 [Halteria grandinella]|uniref:Uncharacterized protein n=1 Tax=Halteria grandinella TaxID=5974 RepID=A0A8J8T582_HALGN|nr:hypothetical protein FGO68_gene17691 [Halteria grandinella]